MKKLSLLLFAATCLHGQLCAQNKSVSSQDIVNKLQSLSSDRVVEKAYLHFDKPYYNPGDTIYFKAYVTAGEKHELSKISGNLHVDLISKNDSIMQSITVQLNNGLAWGDFALPAYTPKGNFRIRAYTQWMQNTGDKYFFDKIIPVTGRSISRVDAVSKAAGKTDVQFFPEGGTFVVALPAKIGFKAIGADGLGVDVKGSVTDDKGVEVAKFNSAHLGMGQFFLTPEAGKNYKAKVTYADGTTSTIDLPKAEEKGMTLTVNNDDAAKIAIELNANKPWYLANKDKEINIIIYAAGIVKTVKTTLDNQSIGFSLAKKDFKTGIMQVTVFGQDGIPLNERLAFIQNADVMALTLASDKQAYSRHDNIKISLNAKSATLPSEGSFSVAVTEDAKVKVDDGTERNILSDLLLTNHLAGYVEQPGYYFTGNTPAPRQNLDILMLTQGYRRFVWKDLLSEDKPNLAYRNENGFSISGTLTTKDTKPIPGEKVTLVLSNSGQSLTETTNAEGKFSFANLGFADKTQFLLKVDNNAIKNKAIVVLDKPKAGVPVSHITQPVPAFIANLPAVNAQQDEPMENKTPRPLKQVNVTDKATVRSANLNGSGVADQVFTRKDFKDATSLSLGLSGKARGVKFSQGIPYLISGTVVTGAGSGQEPMLIIVDGVSAKGNLDNYNPSEIETVEILKGSNASIYGVQGGGGVIVITSRQNNTDDSDAAVVKVMSPGLMSITSPGFYQARQVYAPKYNVSNPQPIISKGTVYWNPNVTTDKDGNSIFEFTCTDTPGNYTVVIEGIDNAGNVGRSVIKYRVM